MNSNKKQRYSLPIGFTSPAVLAGIDESAIDGILVGFSGGADSTALLHMLSEYCKRAPHKIRLCAAHINHGIRGAEANRDEEFCRQTAKELGVEFFALHADVPSIAAERGESIETAARNVRYEYFDSLQKQLGISLLATAHNADDNLETIIFNIARGSALKGICGIPASRKGGNGYVVRPILGMSKEQILEYCDKNELEFVTDSTNLETEYTRNKIRSGIIPIMRQINSAAVENAYRMSKSLEEDSLCIESLSLWFAEELGENCEIDIEKVADSPAAVVNRVLMQIYSFLTEGKTLERVHIDALRELARRGVPHSSVTLPCGIVGVIENGRLCLIKRDEQDIKTAVEAYLLPLFDGNNVISQADCEIFIGNSHNAKNIYKKSIQLSLDFDKIEGELVARSRQEGDKIFTGRMNKSLKKLFCEKKIPLALRSRLPLICDDCGIVAVPSVCIRDTAKVTAQTEHILKITVNFNF